MKKIGILVLLVFLVLFILTSCLTTGKTADILKLPDVSGEYLIYLIEKDNRFAQGFMATCIQSGSSVMITPQEKILLADKTVLRPFSLTLKNIMGKWVLIGDSGLVILVNFYRQERLTSWIATENGLKMKLKGYKIERNLEKFPEIDGTYNYAVFNATARYEGVLEIRGDELVFNPDKDGGFVCEIKKIAVPFGKKKLYGIQIRDSVGYDYYIFYNKGSMVGSIFYGSYFYYMIEIIPKQ